MAILYRDLTKEEANKIVSRLKKEKKKLIKLGGRGNYKTIKIVKGRESGTVFGGPTRQRYNIEVS